MACPGLGTAGQSCLPTEGGVRSLAYQGHGTSWKASGMRVALASSGSSKQQKKNGDALVSLILQGCGSQRDNRLAEEGHQGSTFKSHRLSVKEDSPLSLKSVKESANQKKVLKSCNPSMKNYVYQSLRIQDYQPPKGYSRPETFCSGFSEVTVPKTCYGGEEHEEENYKDWGSEKTARWLQESFLSETAMSDMTICPPPVSSQMHSQLDLPTVVCRKRQDSRNCSSCLQPSVEVAKLRELVTALHANLQQYLQCQSMLAKNSKQVLAEDLSQSEGKVLKELTENSPKETSIPQTDCLVEADVERDDDDSGIVASLGASTSEKDRSLEKTWCPVGERATQEEAADPIKTELEDSIKTEREDPPTQEDAAGVEDKSPDAVCPIPETAGLHKTASQLLKKCIRLAQKFKSFPCMEERMLQFIKSSGRTIRSHALARPWLQEFSRKPQCLWQTPRQVGRSAADSGGGGGRSGHGGAFTFQGGGRGAGGAGRGDHSGAGGRGQGESGRERRDEPGRGDELRPSRDVADMSSIPEMDHRRNCEAAHAHLSETVLFDILGAVGTTHWQTLEQRWLRELQRCLSVVLHDVRASMVALRTCSVCAVLQSLLSHFVNCQRQQQCALCLRAFFVMQFHAHMCLSLDRSRERFSQADICYQVCLSVNFDPQLLRCLTERVWGKMHKYLSKVLTVFCTEEEESTEQQSPQLEHTVSGGRSTRLGRRYAPSLKSIAEVQGWSHAGADCSGALASDPYDSSLRAAPDPQARPAALVKPRDWGGARPKSSNTPHLWCPEKASECSTQGSGNGNGEGVFLSSNSGGELEACSSSSGHSLVLKHKLRCTVPALACDFAGLVLPGPASSFAEVGTSMDLGAPASHSLPSAASQDSQPGEVVENQPQSAERNRSKLDWPNKEFRFRIGPESPSDMPKTYGTTGWQSLPDSVSSKTAMQGSQQLLSLETRPVGKPGIGEVVYGTKKLLQDEARHWGSKAEQLHHQSRYQRHLREEGVILDSVKDKLRVVGTRYQKHIQWRRLVHLGSGVSGKCSLAVDLNSDRKFCVKRIHLSGFGESELETWSQVKHRNIVQLYGAVRHGQKVYIFAELIDGGNLSACINRQRELNRRLSHWSALCIFQQILEALVHLKTKDIVHEDLKADNILIRSVSGKVDLGACIRIAIADFGTAQRVTDDRGRSKQNPLGAPTQWSPEKAASEGHSFPADLWAATCVLVHMLSGTPPWMRRYGNAAALHYIIFTKSPPMEDVPDNIQRAVRDLIEKGFTRDPARRPTAQQLLQHPAFQLLRANKANPDVLYSVLQSPHTPSVDNRLSQQHSDEGVQQILESLKMDQPPLPCLSHQGAENSSCLGSTGEGERSELLSMQGGAQAAADGSLAAHSSQQGRTFQVVELPGPSSRVPASAESSEPKGKRVEGKEKSVTVQFDVAAFVAYDPPLLPLAVKLTLPGCTVAAEGAVPACPILQSSHSLICTPPRKKAPGQQVPGFTDEHVSACHSAISSAPDLAQEAYSGEESLTASVLSSRLLSSSGHSITRRSTGCSPSEEGEETEEAQLLMQYVKDLELGDWPQNFPTDIGNHLYLFATEERKEGFTQFSQSICSTLSPLSANVPTFLKGGHNSQAAEDVVRISMHSQASPVDHAWDQSSMFSIRDHFDSSEMFPSEPVQSLPQLSGMPTASSMAERSQQPANVDQLQTLLMAPPVSNKSLHVVLPSPDSHGSVQPHRRTRTMSEVVPGPTYRPPQQLSCSHPSSPQTLIASPSEALSSGSPRNMSPFDQQEELFKKMNSVYDESNNSNQLMEEFGCVPDIPEPFQRLSLPEPSSMGHLAQLEQLQQSLISFEDDSSEPALDLLQFKREDGSLLCKVRLPRCRRDWQTLWDLISPNVQALGHVTLLHADGRHVNPLVPPNDEENSWIIAPVAEDSEQCWCETHFMMR